MVRLSNLITVKETTGPQLINHYNLFRSAEIDGGPAPGYSSGQALQKMEALGEEPAAGHDLRSGRGCRSRKSRPAASRS